MEKDTLVEVSFGEWLRRRRKAAGLTQKQLALQINCSTSELKKLEAEVRRPSAQIVERLAEIFHIAHDERITFLRFARGDWDAAPVGVIENLSWRTSIESPRSNLPSSLTSLIGREQELTRLGEYLSDPGIRLVTLIGPPGIGKTRLSVEVGRESLSDFPNGVFFVSLASLDNPNLVGSTIVQTLGLAEKKSRLPIERLKDGIGDKQMLLVLDNVEHLLEGTATLASELLSACSHLKILATSREALRVPGEWLFPVPVLSIPTTKQLQSIDMETALQFEALTLFAERTRAARPDFALNADNIHAVANICAQLDGLPLAIELIAARIRWMSPQTIFERLSGQFTLYADGMRAVSARQKTLHNAIVWSYNLLSPEEQNLFAGLSVFSGGFTLHAAESIFSRTSTTKTVSDLISSLLDKSLLQGTLDESGEPRFTLLVTIQQFALDHLRRMGSEEEIRSWHLAYFLELAEQAYQKMYGPDQFKWLDRLELEHDNLRVAWDYAIASNAEFAFRLVPPMDSFWAMRGKSSEGQEWMTKLLPLTEQWRHSTRLPRVLVSAARLELTQSNIVEARRLLEEALPLARRSEDASVIARTLLRLGRTLHLQHEYDAARPFIEESLFIYQGLQDQWGIATAMFRLAALNVDQGHHAEAEDLYAKSLAKYRLLGDKYSEAYVLNFWGELARLQGNYEHAVKFYEEAMEIFREHRNPALVFPLYNLAWVSLHAGYHHQAWALFEESLELVKEVNDKDGIACCLGGFAGVLGTIGKLEEAARLFGTVESLDESIGIAVRVDPSDQREFDYYIGAVRGQLDAAAFEKAWQEGRAMTMEQAIAYARIT